MSPRTRGAAALAAVLLIVTLAPQPASAAAPAIDLGGDHALIRFRLPDDAPIWTTAPADPGVPELFGDAVYDRGAMTLHQLRRAVGDDAFFTILRTWTADHRYGNGTTAEFTALAEKISGQDLDALFQAWLYTPAKPVVASLARKAPVAPKSWAQISLTHRLLQE